jgi:hypothetical protein
MYKITERAMEDKAMLLPMVTGKHLQKMLKESAVCTHTFANRRYNEFVFLIENREVVAIGLMKHKIPGRALGHLCNHCFGTKRIQVSDICTFCDGAGCKQCNDEGEVAASIRCPHCK